MAEPHPSSVPWSCEPDTVLPSWWPPPPVAEPEEPRPFELDATPSMRSADVAIALGGSL